jgi:ferredoxin
VRACEELGSSAISLIMRGTQKRVATPYDEAAAVCIGCGTCARVCPAGAIEMTEKEGIRVIWNKAFAMQACSRCGSYYASREEIAHLTARKPEYVIQSDLCEDCRKRMMAEKIAVFVSE